MGSPGFVFVSYRRAAVQTGPAVVSATGIGCRDRGHSAHRDVESRNQHHGGLSAHYCPVNLVSHLEVRIGRTVATLNAKFVASSKSTTFPGASRNSPERIHALRLSNRASNSTGPLTTMVGLTIK